MPYIPEKDRDHAEHEPQTSGELNFAFTKLIDQFVHDHGLRYATFNTVIGALEGAKLEFYRRVVAPYENIKIQQNGDVYTCLQGEQDDQNPRGIGTDGRPVFGTQRERS
jgi:hypothetical protein